MVNRSFWAEKPVFITGHTGFKGGWLTTWLADMGARVFGYALAPSTKPSYFELCGISAKAQSTLADIRDEHALTGCLREAAPEIVFHLAAQPLVHQSFRDPAATIRINTLGTLNVLEAIRATPTVKAAVIITSDKCYENFEWPWGYRETDILGGHDPYSASKACAEILCSAYRRSFFENERSPMALATVRAGNVIGGGDWSSDRIVPDAIRAFVRGASLSVRNAHAVRPWQHVLDPLSGYLSVAERLYEEGSIYASAWNFGPYEQSAVSVSVLVNMLVRHWGRGAAWHSEGLQPAFHEAIYLRLDCGKARAKLNWQPTLSLEQAVEQTVAWYSAAAGGNTDMFETSRAQIRHYERLMQQGTA